MYYLKIGIKKLSSYLLSQAVSHQVSSTYKGLTSVFGMGTGVPPWQSPLSMVKGISLHPQN